MYFPNRPLESAKSLLNALTPPTLPLFSVVPVGKKRIKKNC